MKNCYLVLLSALLIFSGCNGNDGEPVAPYLGTYQYVESRDTLDYIRSVELREGNIAVEQGTVRNKGEAVELGYTHYRTGTYSLDVNRLTISIDYSASANAPDKIYVDREDLEVSGDFLEYSEYKFSENYSKLNYLCPPNAFCVGPLPVYKKVNPK